MLKGYDFTFHPEPVDIAPDMDFVPFAWNRKDKDDGSDKGMGGDVGEGHDPTDSLQPQGPMEILRWKMCHRWVQWGITRSCILCRIFFEGWRSRLSTLIPELLVLVVVEMVWFPCHFCARHDPNRQVATCPRNGPGAGRSAADVQRRVSLPGSRLLPLAPGWTCRL